MTSMRPLTARGHFGSVEPYLKMICFGFFLFGLYFKKNEGVNKRRILVHKGYLTENFIIIRFNI